MSATGRNLEGRERRADDFYETPEWVTRAIVPYLPLAGGVIDAGCGTGAILKVLASEGAHYVDELVGVEIDPSLAEKAEEVLDEQDPSQRVLRVDFLTLAGHPNLVVMNPPFSLAREFVEHALEMTRGPRGTVAALLRLNWLASKERNGFHKQNPSDVFVLSKRPSFAHGKTDATEYAWFVWGPGRGNRWQVLDGVP